jgi:uncharacterized protein (UPF0548 family)
VPSPRPGWCPASATPPGADESTPGHTGPVLLRIRRPSDAAVAEILARSAEAPFSYPEVGATGHAELPAGYEHAQLRVRLGEGDAAFARARAAIGAWRGFDIPWIELHGRDQPPVPGVCVAPVARALGLWSLNVARVVTAIDESDRFGFAYGTLPAHAERGEERFLVERDFQGSVWYEIRVFSRPQLWWARLGKPIIARQQRRFRVASADAMSRAVTS